MTVQEKLYNLIDQRIFINEVKDGQSLIILNHVITFFDIHSTKIKQFGFNIALEDGKLTCLGDEPYHEACYPVSYTHLDVYKRQFLAASLPAAIAIEQSASLKAKTSLTPSPLIATV